MEKERVAALRQALRAEQGRLMLFNAGRFDPAKRWLMAVEAAARLKRDGYRIVFPFRGGIEAIVVDTDRPEEIVSHLAALAADAPGRVPSGGRPGRAPRSVRGTGCSRY